MNTHAQPLITLFTVVRNVEAHLREALESVRAQTFRDFEYIVLDGASADKTPEIIHEYSDVVTFFRSAPDRCSYDAMNQALNMAKGQIIGALSADDWLAPDALATLAELHRAAPDAGIFGFGLQEHEPDAHGMYRPVRTFLEAPGERFTLENSLYCQGLSRFYSRDVIARAGEYDFTRYPKLADRAWYMNVAALNPKKVTTGKVLYHFRCHAGSISAGSGARGTLVSLEEMRRIALDYEKTNKNHADVSNWYAFTMVRLACFRLRNGQVPGAFTAVIEALLRRPLHFIKRILSPAMPKSYQPKELA